MPGGISALLNTARTALTAQTAGIRTIGNNVANVNTPGYSRRSVELVTGLTEEVGDSNLGLGVTVNNVRRVVDDFINRQLEERKGGTARADIRNEFMARLQSSFGVDGALETIGSALGEFFSALDDLAANPADIPLRAAVLDAGQRLAGTINSAYSNLASLQREADDRMARLVPDVNDIIVKLNDINTQIRGTELGDQENLGLRDQRDELLRQLSSKISYTKTEFDDGAVGISLANGFSLISQTSFRTLEFTHTPSFASVGGFPPGLDGSSLGFVVYDYDSGGGTSHIDLTNVLAGGSGEAAGLLTIRGVQSITDTSGFDAVGDIVEVGARVEAIAQDLLTRFNLTNLGPDEDGGVAGHQASTGDLSGVAPVPFGLFTFQGANAGADFDADGVPEVTDLNSLGIESFARILRFKPTTPESIVAALDQNPAAGAISLPPGNAGNIVNPATGLSRLRTEAVNYSVYVNGNVPVTSTIENMYNQTVTLVGSLKALADRDATLAKDQESQTQELQSAISGVNTDEELAKLISFQRAFQASARMIGTADQLLNEIINLAGS